MHDIDDDTSKGAIGELILDQVKLILEVVSDQPTRREFNELSTKVDELKSDVQVIRAAVTDQSADIRAHDARLINLSSTVDAHDKQLRSLRRKAA